MFIPSKPAIRIDNAARLQQAARIVPMKATTDEPYFRVEQIMFNPDSSRLTGAGLYTKVWVWDVTSGEELNAFQFSGGGKHPTIFFSSDAALVVLSGSSDGIFPMPDFLQVRDVRTGQEVLDEAGDAVGFSPRRTKPCLSCLHTS